MRVPVADFDFAGSASGSTPVTAVSDPFDVRWCSSLELWVKWSNDAGINFEVELETQMTDGSWATVPAAGFSSTGGPASGFWSPETVTDSKFTALLRWSFAAWRDGSGPDPASFDITVSLWGIG